MSELVQVAKRSGKIKRAPRGQTPIVELHLEAHEHVVSVDLQSAWETSSDLDRKTCDWHWTAYIATRLGEAA